MKTRQLYLHDSYLKDMEATIMQVEPESDNRFRLILDATVFYPMGGGQPTDQGTLMTDSWSAHVYQVMMKEGELWHYIESAKAPSVGLKVKGTINWERRFKHMRLHSAGHIVDFAIFLLGYSPKVLMPLKGDHGKKPFIVYTGSLTEDITQRLQEKVNELTEKKLKFSWLFQPLEDLQKEAIYLQPGLPPDKPLRTLKLETVGAVADGGTQVHTTDEVGKVIITAIETKDNQTIVKYQIT